MREVEGRLGYLFELSDKQIKSLPIANGTLAGHLSIELSRVLDYFLYKEDFIELQITGKVKREVGLLDPDQFIAHTKDQELYFDFTIPVARLSIVTL